MQKNLYSYDLQAYVVRSLIWILALNSGEILREFGEILGKYRILDGRSVGFNPLDPTDFNPMCGITP